MRHRVVAVTDLEAGGAAIDEKAGDTLFCSAGRRLLAGGDEHDDEVGDVGVADEVFRAVDDPIAAVPARVAIHAAHIGAGIRLGHRQRIDLLAADRRREISLPLLLVAGAEDVRWAAPPDRERHRGPAKLPLEQRERQLIEATAAERRGNVRGIKAEIDDFPLDLSAELERNASRPLDLALKRVELAFDE